MDNTHPLLGDTHELRHALIQTVDRMCTGKNGAFDEDAPPASCPALLKAVEPLRNMAYQCPKAPLPKQNVGILAALDCGKKKHDDHKCFFPGMPRSG